ncbi:branched-chain amino acid ABC transporter permease [Chelatococcus reniformis]|uniref:Branched-chain amino acid ABC transporter permease n=1 Tax=Chelatococcus reniformis TaxID=1494448 RepID=A0A916U6E6_9HYPH|nr:branched-chain amino acid ABC transporter permease [Chelatococcus reniformis]GGC61541.1 branched-chain amino acid ABC transporter permease [Chelatococcus reniformis]
MSVEPIRAPAAALLTHRHLRRLVGATLALAGIAIWAALPQVLSRGTVDLLVFTALYAIAGLGVAFLLGQCGIVSLAQSVFYGIGAYATAYCCTTWGWPWYAALVIGMVISGATALVIGWPVLRLSGYFLALATLALATIGHVLFLEWDWLTGGTLGVGGIPQISLFGLVLNTPQKFYYFIWPLAALIYWLLYNLLHSRSGYAMRAMRDAPAAALVLGIDVHKLKVRIFVLSALLGSLAGSLFANYVSFVSVDSFGVDRAVSFLLLAVVGGAQSVIGPLFGAAFVTLVPNLLSRVGDVHPLLFAGVLVVAVIFLPQGMGGLVTTLWRRLWPPAPPAPGSGT